MKQSIRSIVKKLKTIAENGTSAYQHGKYNFENPKPEFEDLARERYENHCKGCEHFIAEPIKRYQLNDPRIPELSKMYCEDCCCIAAYKLRQTLDICKFWDK